MPTGRLSDGDEKFSTLFQAFTAVILLGLFIYVFYIGPTYEKLAHEKQYKGFSETQAGKKAQHLFETEMSYMDSLRMVEWKKNHFKKQGDE